MPPAWYVSFIELRSGRGVKPSDKLKQFAYLGPEQEFLASLAQHAEPDPGALTAAARTTPSCGITSPTPSTGWTMRARCTSTPTGSSPPSTPACSAAASARICWPTLSPTPARGGQVEICLLLLLHQRGRGRRGAPGGHPAGADESGAAPVLLQPLRHHVRPQLQTGEQLHAHRPGQPGPVPKMLAAQAVRRPSAHPRAAGPD